MPTPFYHLSVAKELVRHPALSRAGGALLQGHFGAFLLGSTAPDVQTISGQTRSSTHFFDFPVHKQQTAPWLALLEQNRHLADVHHLRNVQAAFLSGYLCHLLADWMWIRQIFIPFFGMKSEWSSFGERLYLHNVLRSYLEVELLPGLANGISTALQQVMPSGWLPAVADDDLLRWRDFISNQLQPGAAIKTIDVFAARQGIAPEAYYQILQSEERMERDIFAHVSRERLREYRLYIIAESTTLINNYLAGRLAPARSSWTRRDCII